MLFYITEASKSIVEDSNPFPEMSEYDSYDSLQQQIYDKNKKYLRNTKGWNLKLRIIGVRLIEKKVKKRL